MEQCGFLPLSLSAVNYLRATGALDDILTAGLTILCDGATYDVIQEELKRIAATPVPQCVLCNHSPNRHGGKPNDHECACCFRLRAVPVVYVPRSQ